MFLFRRMSVLFCIPLLATGCDTTPVEVRPAQDAAPLTMAAAPAPPTCTKTWSSGVGGNWMDASRWVPNGVPGTTDEVCFTAPGTYDVLLTVPVTVYSIELGGPGVNATLEMDLPAGSLIDLVRGITVEHGSTLRVPSDGQVTIQASPLGSSLTNYGTIEVFNSCACGGTVAELDFNQIGNAGRMELEAPMTVRAGYWQNSAGVLITRGTESIDHVPSGLATVQFYVGGGSSIQGSAEVHTPVVRWTGGTIGTTGHGRSVVQAWDGIDVDEIGTHSGQLDAGLVGAFLDVRLGTLGSSATLQLRVPSPPSEVWLLEQPGAPMVNNGTIEIVTEPNATTDVLIFSDFTNRGTLEALGTGRLQVRGLNPPLELANEGQLLTTDADIVATGATRITNSGGIHSSGAAALLVNGDSHFIAEAGSTASIPMVLEGARLSGTGDVASVTSIGGTVAPGSPSGTLSATEVDLDPNSELEINVSGGRSGSYGRLEVAGEMSYGGSLRIVNPGTNQPGRCGDVITPITHVASGQTGTFLSHSGLTVTPQYGWRVQPLLDSLVVAGHAFDPAPLTLTRSHFALREGGAADQMHVCLGPLAPNSDVAVKIGSRLGQLNRHPPLIYRSGNWRLPQSLWVAALDDARVEGPHSDTLFVSSDVSSPAYPNGLRLALPVSIEDNDGSADLELVFHNAPAATTVGSSVEVVFRLTNHGPTLSTGATFTLDPQGTGTLDFVGDFAVVCSEDAAGLLTCAVGALAAGTTIDVAFTFDAIAVGSVTLHGSVDGVQIDPVPSNNSDGTTITIN